MKKLCTLAILFLLLRCSGLGQQYVFYAYRHGEGLNNLSIHKIRQDAQGFLWIGTENGVYRFSGANFQRLGSEVGLTEDEVTDLYIDPSGTVWVATEENLYRWTGAQFVPLLSTNRKTPVLSDNNLASLNATHLLIVSQGKLLLAETPDQGKHWITRPFFSADQIHRQPNLEKLHSIYVTSHGEFWMGCANAICRYSQEQVSTWNEANHIPQERWVAFLESRSGSIWAQGAHHLLELAAGAPAFIDRTYAGLQKNAIYSFQPLAEDKQGNLIASGDDSLLRWDGKTWHNIGRSNGLDSGHTTAFFFDRSGDLWIGSAGRGLFHWISYNNWESWTTQQNLPNDLIWSVHPGRDQRIYIGTGSGLSLLDRNDHRITYSNEAASGMDGQISSFAEDKQHNIWAGTFSGSLIRIDGKTKEPRLIAHLPFIFRLVTDNAGRVWVCTRRELYVIDRPEREIKLRRVDEINSLLNDTGAYVTNACLAPSGTVWFATGKSLLRYTSGHWSHPEIQGIENRVPIQALTCSKDNSLWIAGHSGGISHLHEQGEKLLASNVAFGIGLQHAETLALLEDHRGWLWVGTDFGVAAFNGEQWRVINTESGLIWNDITQDAIQEDADGSIWIGTSHGLAHLLHPEWIFDPVHLGVFVTKAERDGKRLPSQQAFDLPWSQSALTFHLEAPSFLNTSSLQFQYRLEGLDSTWATTQNLDIRYSALPPGSYRLEVMAANPTLHSLASATSISFRILPPWWRTNLFYALCCLLISILAFVLYRWRTLQLIAQQHKLELLVKERTSELEHSRAQLHLQATHDGLTGLLNRTAILDVLRIEIERSIRTQTPLAVILADLDHFKHVNDSYGHQAGDQVLQEVARRFQKNVRPYDFIGRYGGEELLLIVPGAQQEKDGIPSRLAQLHNCVSNQPIQVVTHNERVFDIAITCSFGVSWFTGEMAMRAKTTAHQIEALLHLSDTALYRAKHLGRNRIEYANE